MAKPTVPPLALPGDYKPTANWQVLRRRAEMLRQIRRFFDEQGFLEVETPILSADTVVDRHLDPFCLETPAGRRWLQTSPEFAMKRLLAAGAEAIYQVARVFRQDELGRLHNPEFTMVEWYRSGETPEAGMRRLGELVETVVGRGPAEKITYREAFELHAGLDPHSVGTAGLIAAARRLGIESPASLGPDDRDGWLDLLLAEAVSPRLGIGRPAIVFDYPASQAALARVRGDNPPVAERFELYIDGIELANGYHELLDAAVLRSRIKETNAWRRREGKQPLPEDSRLLAAMEAGLPQSVGVALGFDRLVLVAAGARSLGEVMAFPFDRA